MTKFTPGPWAVHPVLARVDAFNLFDGDPVCQLLWPTELRSEEETEANGLLIAAAPQLLSALQEARKGCQLLEDLCACRGDDDYVSELLATIDRAISAALAPSNPEDPS